MLFRSKAAFSRQSRLSFHGHHLAHKPPAELQTIPPLPDTYFIASNEKYVFIEYTTQRTNLFAKIRDDLEKCLDTAKTGVPYDKISEIIYCHTSSNLTPFQDSEVKKLCEDVGVKLVIIGIDKLAEDIYLFHHNHGVSHVVTRPVRLDHKWSSGRAPPRARRRPRDDPQQRDRKSVV